MYKHNPLMSAAVEQGTINPFQPNLIPTGQQMVTNPFQFTPVQQMGSNPFQTTAVQPRATHPFQFTAVPPMGSNPFQTTAVQPRATNTFQPTAVQQTNTNQLFTGVEQSPANPFQNLPSNNGFDFVFHGNAPQPQTANDATQSANPLQLSPGLPDTGSSSNSLSESRRERGRRVSGITSRDHPRLTPILD
jgi:hypothetical protein